MSLLFLARRLDEIAFGPVWSLVRVPPIANLCPPETPIYTQLKIRFTIYVHLKVLHDTPPLRGLQRLVSLHFKLKSSSPWKPLFRKPGFRPLLGPISPGWTPGLDSFLANSLSNFNIPASSPNQAGWHRHCTRPA
jgi:hypothetical protein